MHPILFQFGPVTLYSYGLMVALGFMVGLSLALRRAREVNLPPAQIQAFTLLALLAGLIGARATYVALHWDFFRGDLLEILRLDHGGLVYYGGFGLSFLVVLWTIRKNRFPVWKTVDLLIPPLVIAHALGRIGWFLNGCCYGKPSDVPWAVVFPQESIARHPTQLYESAFLLLLFFYLKSLERKDASTVLPGTVTFTYGFLYGAWRFFIEFLRGDNPVILWGLTAFQGMSLVLMALSGGFLLRMLLRRARPLVHRCEAPKGPKQSC